MTNQFPQSEGGLDVAAKHLDRRQLVKAAAWAAPALVLAAATPSASASPTPSIPDLVFTNFSAAAQTRFADGHSVSGPPWWVDGYTVLNRLEGNTAVGLSYFAASPAATVSSITLTLTVTNATGLVGAMPTVTSGSGWVASSGALSNTTATYVFTWAGSIAAGQAGLPSYTAQLGFSLPADDVSKPSALPWPKTVSAMAIATGARSATTSAAAGQP